MENLKEIVVYFKDFDKEIGLFNSIKENTNRPTTQSRRTISEKYYFIKHIFLESFKMPFIYN